MPSKQRAPPSPPPPPLQNKVDLVTEAAALNQHETIQRFIQVGRRGAAA